MIGCGMDVQRWVQQAEYLEKAQCSIFDNFVLIEKCHYVEINMRHKIHFTEAISQSAIFVVLIS